MLQTWLAMLRIVADLLRTCPDSQQIGAEHGLHRVEWQRLEAAHERRGAVFAVRSLDSQQNKVDSQQRELDSHHPEAARLALRVAHAALRVAPLPRQG